MRAPIHGQKMMSQTSFMFRVSSSSFSLRKLKGRNPNIRFKKTLRSSSTSWPNLLRPSLSAWKPWCWAAGFHVAPGLEKTFKMVITTKIVSNSSFPLGDTVQGLLLVEGPRLGVLVDLPCLTTLVLSMWTMLPLILPSSAALMLFMTMVFRHGSHGSIFLRALGSLFCHHEKIRHRVGGCNSLLRLKDTGTSLEL